MPAVTSTNIQPPPKMVKDPHGLKEFSIKVSAEPVRGKYRWTLVRQSRYSGWADIYEGSSPSPSSAVVDAYIVLTQQEQDNQKD